MRQTIRVFHEKKKNHAVKEYNNLLSEADEFIYIPAIMRLDFIVAFEITLHITTVLIERDANNSFRVHNLYELTLLLTN